MTTSSLVPNSHNIFFATDAEHPDAPFKWLVQTGDLVELRLRQDSLYAEVVKDLGGGRFRGRATFFECSPEDALDGVALGDVIEFEIRNIFACHAT